jgi:hypothetical protein
MPGFSKNEAILVRYPFKLFSVAAVLSFASVALGDGCYIPEQAVRKVPAIPAQRAVLSWRDATETLVIESALDSEAQRLGWLIPLPAVPRTIDKESPGALKAIGSCIQPKITHDLTPLLVLTIVAVSVANLLMGTLLFARKQFVTVLVTICLLAVLYSLLLSASGTAGAATAKKAVDVLVEKSATVGSYDVNVLRPSKLDGLNAWLCENRFSAFPASADRAVTDYISKGWVFAAIKLTRTEKGANTPHPIKMAFASKQAVYPLQLTAIAGGSPQFEIVVIGDGSASCDLLAQEYCDRFSKEEIARDDATLYFSPTLFRPSTTNCPIGHPAICSLMWDKCVLTKLAGTIDSRDMTKDIHFGWRPFEALQQHFYTESGARDLVLILFIGLTGGWCFVSMVACEKRILKPRGLGWFATKVLLPATAILAIGSGIAFNSLPKPNPSEVQVRRGGDSPEQDSYRLSSAIESILAEHPEILQGTNDQISSSLLKYLGDGPEREFLLKNRLADTAIKVEDSPGNFTVEKQKGKVLVRVYGPTGGFWCLECRLPDHEKESRKQAEH